MTTSFTPKRVRHVARLVAYISWGSIGVEEMTASLDDYNGRLERKGIPARLAFAGTWSGTDAKKIAVRFNGEDTTKVCATLGLTADELLGADVGLAMGMD